MQEHIQTGKVVCGMINLLTEETLFDDMFVKLFLRLQKQRAGTCRRVVNLIDSTLIVYSQTSNKLRDALRGEELATGLTGVGGLVVNQELVGIAKEVYVVVLEVAEVQSLHTLYDRRQTAVLVLHSVAEPGACGVKIGKQSFDVLF